MIYARMILFLLLASNHTLTYSFKRFPDILIIRFLSEYEIKSIFAEGLKGIFNSLIMVPEI